MADSAVAVTAGTGTNIDTRTESTNGNHRQVVVVGDPATNAGVAPVDATTGLVVNIGPGVDLGSGTGGSKTPRVLIDSSQLGSVGQTTASASTPVVPASDWVPTGVFTDDNTFTAASSRVYAIGCVADEASIDSVDEDDVGAPRMTKDRKQVTTMQPHTTGGYSVAYSLDLDEAKSQVKSSVGQLYKLRLTNFATSTRYVLVYQLPSASVTVGTTTPDDVIVLPPASASNPTVLTEAFGGMGILGGGTGITLAATTASNGTGAPSANDVAYSAYYK